MATPLPTLTFPILLSQLAVDRLTVLKNSYNAETGQALTLTEWVTFHLREMAIQAEWSASVQTLQAQLQANTNAMVRSEHDRLVATV